MKNCLACICNKDQSIAPGGRIKEYNHWILEHIIEPIPKEGWLILKTKRHTEGIMGLNQDESAELGTILFTVPKTLQQVMGAEMIYVHCLTELVKHLHIHLIPRLPNDSEKGATLFMKLGEVNNDPSKGIAVEKCMNIISQLKRSL